MSFRCCICGRPATHKHSGGRGGGHPSYVCLKHTGKTSTLITIKESLANMAKFHRMNSISITGGIHYRYVLRTNRVEYCALTDVGRREGLHDVWSVELPEDLAQFFHEQDAGIVPEFQQFLVMYKGWHQAQVHSCFKQPDKLKLELKSELFVMFLDFTTWTQKTYKRERVNSAMLYERWYGTHEVVEDGKQLSLGSGDGGG